MSSERRWKIYTLNDPRTGEVRYVGMTHRAARLYEHVYRPKRERTHVACWIKSLSDAGLRPSMVVLEEGVGPSWAERERYWISEMRRLSVRLTNLTDGGEGTLGWSPSEEFRRACGVRSKRVHTGLKRSPEARARMSAAQKRLAEERKASGVRVRIPPKSEETLRRMSEAQKGKKLSAETRQKIGAATRNATPELRAKWAESARNRPAEWRAWFAQNQKGKPKSAETRAKMSAARKAYWDQKKGVVAKSQG